MCHLCDKAPPSRQPTRRSFLATATGVAAGLVFAPRAFAKDAKPPPKPQNVISPDEALERLMKGNGRYVDGISRRHDSSMSARRWRAGKIPMPAS